ncbi:hypothetical protein QBC39DRAFT_139072 [Podospora conica]|nr:hypothetical protein QBC39DRAFT_139072 [Schizothecium conicum]
MDQRQDAWQPCPTISNGGERSCPPLSFPGALSFDAGGRDSCWGLVGDGLDPERQKNLKESAHAQCSATARPPTRAPKSKTPIFSHGRSGVCIPGSKTAASHRATLRLAAAPVMRALFKQPRTPTGKSIPAGPQASAGGGQDRNALFEPSPGMVSSLGNREPPPTTTTGKQNSSSFTCIHRQSRYSPGLKREGGSVIKNTTAKRAHTGPAWVHFIHFIHSPACLSACLPVCPL